MMMDIVREVMFDNAYLDQASGHVGRCNSHAITMQGNRVMINATLVQSAHYILGHFGEDCDLRRFGGRLTKRGGKAAKKRAAVAVARKLAVIMHRLRVDQSGCKSFMKEPKTAA